jgi:hypothetical protein
MMNMSTNSSLVVVVALVAALFARLRVVRIESLRIGSVSLGSAQFCFANERSPAALPASEPAPLPSRSGRVSRSRAERSTAKSKAQAA